MSKHEPLRHLNKTAEDKLPVHLRQRVQAATARREAMRRHKRPELSLEDESLGIPAEGHLDKETR